MVVTNVLLVLILCAQVYDIIRSEQSDSYWKNQNVDAKNENLRLEAEKRSGKSDARRRG